MDAPNFAPRELDIMGILWRNGSGSVSEVRDALTEDLAYTSVLSALQWLEKKGYVSHQAEGRAYRYYPLVDPESAGGTALDRIREAMYKGSSERLFVQLLSDRNLKKKDLERLRTLVNERIREEEP